MKKPLQNETTLKFSNRPCRKILGKKGEEAVVSFLKNEGYKVLVQNYAKRTGEIDIIAKKNEILVFVEVKLRLNNYFNLSEVITFSKQKKIIATAKKYIVEHKWFDAVFRFDVALVHKKEDVFSITYIPNAYTEMQRY